MAPDPSPAHRIPLPPTVGTRRTLASAPEKLRLSTDDDAPLGEHRLGELEHARRRARPLRRAARAASLSAWSTLVFGLAALPFALGDLKTMALSLALIAVGYNELCARRALFRFEINAPARLAINQLILAGVIIGYALLSIFDLGPMNLSTDALDPSMIQNGGVDQESIETLSQMLSAAVYAGLIVGTVLFQGSSAIYYITKKRALRRFLASTPPWVIETMHALRTL